MPMTFMCVGDFHSMRWMMYGEPYMEKAFITRFVLDDLKA